MEFVDLSEEQQKLYEYIESHEANVFVTGRAGTGKSTLLQYLIENTSKSVAVCAPTGVAALNVGGRTIHSLFGFPLGVLGLLDITKHLNRRVREILRAIDMLVIDEVSMVNPDILDAIDKQLRTARGKRGLPFGGAQVVMFGDVYQLPPIPPRGADGIYMAENYQSNWFFHAHVWRDTDLERYELMEIFRQRDGRFKDILNAVRDGSVTQDMLDELNSHAVRAVPNDDILRLKTINESVDGHNRMKLAKLSTKAHIYHAQIPLGDVGDFRQPPAEQKLELKPGAQVMFIKNDDSSPHKDSDGRAMQRWVNGTIGRVVEIKNDAHLTVEVDGELHDVGRSKWEKVTYEIEEYFDESAATVREKLVAVPVAEFRQIPLRLAWAVTVHKSQGQTYDEVAIDFGDRVFAAGQAYVALSRVRSLEGLYLTRPLRMADIKVDMHVQAFMAGHHNAAPPELEEPDEPLFLED
ncbi:MAG: ATP-dependent RecD-like DNA helicase [Micrococcales bacterium]